MQQDIERVSALIGDIYDASLDPSLWPSVFEKASAYVGGSTASLVAQDTISKTAQIYFNWGTAPAYVQLYVDKYCKLNPLFPAIFFFGVEETYWVPDCLPRDEFCRSQFAKEWLGPQGYVDGLFTNVDKSATSCAVFSVFRTVSDGFVDDDMRRRFALLVPHVRRALLIGKVVDLQRIEAAALADSLDALASGMFLVDQTGHIIHANASGRVMVADRNVLHSLKGHLSALDPIGDQALLSAFSAAAGGDAALGRRGIAVPLKARDGVRYVANVMSLTGGARRRAGVSYAAVAAVFVHKAVLELPSPPEAVAREFQLTPAELRVLFAIIQVGGVPEVADVLGITEGTVKSHLHHVFEKTETSRQADLVKLVAGYTNALLG